MKVVVIGGAGAFGSRLVDLLRRDGHQVWVAGRTQLAVARVAAQYDAQWVVVDRGGDLGGIWVLAPDAVVDAAGPFHAYGKDPYALARACIAQGVHYLDLADTPDFCAGISTLNAAAVQAGVFVLSGMSSVPAVSSAAVIALAENAEIDTIDTAILPGNKAPRGRSVVGSILHQTGVPFDVTIDGVRQKVTGWSQPKSYELSALVRRQGWMVAVPDQRLFPLAFAARTVMFRAGLELGVMNYGLAVTSWIRARLRLGMPAWFVALMHRLAMLLWPFGTDIGGMSVSVVRRVGTGWQQRTWLLLAKRGDGPFVPTIAVRAALRDPTAIPSGARPAVGVVSLAACTAAMSDLEITTQALSQDLKPIFQTVLGQAVHDLPNAVQAAHDVPGPRVWSGRAKVIRGNTRWSRLIAMLFRFPKADAYVPVMVTMTPEVDREIWVRQFAQSSFKSTLRPTLDGMTERFGPLTFLLDLQVKDGGLHFPVRRGWCLGVPIPRVLLPVSHAVESEVDGRFQFDVSLHAPMTHDLIVRYQGWLVRAADMVAEE